MLSYLSNFTQPQLPVVFYVIERLTYHLQNSPSLVWREQSLNIIGTIYNNEVFIKQNDDIPTLEGMLYLISNYTQSQLDDYNKKLANSIATGDSSKTPKVDTLINQLLKSLSIITSILKSTMRWIPSNNYVDVQTKFQLS